MSVFLRKYNTLTVTGTTAIRIPMIKRAVVDFAVSADWTPAAGDVKIAVDGTAPANVANLPVATASGNAAYWEFVLTAAELSCKQAIITISDSATKAVEDNAFIVETYGNASAMYQADLSAANLPANIIQVNGTTQTARDLGASVLLSSGTGTGQLSLSAGLVTLAAVTHTGATIPTVTTTATATNLTNAPTAGDFTSTMKTSLNAATPASVVGAVGSVTGAVGSVTGAVGSVTGAVGSVTGNVGGNVTGSVGSVAGSVASVTAGVTVTTNNDKTGYALSATGSAALTESYAADGAAPTLAQILYQIMQFLHEKSISGTTMTVKKIDGSTSAMTFTLNDATTPTSITRAS